MRSVLWVSTTLAASLTFAQVLTLDEVLFRANETVVGFEREFSTVITEEVYIQRVLRPDGSLVRERTVVSDLALVRYEGEEIWNAFRDVLEVDGKSIGPRSGRWQTSCQGVVRKRSVRQSRFPEVGPPIFCAAWYRLRACQRWP